MNPIYNLGVRAYAGGVRLAAPFHRKAALLSAGRRQTFDILRRSIDAGRSYVWVHAASLGEFEQGRPLMERIRRERPDLGIVLTFFSPSGYEVRKNYAGADVVCYLPADTPSAARRFVDLVRPVAAVFVKYEFWGNFLSELQRREIPVYLVSAIFRPSQSFFKWWGGAFRSMLKCFTRIFVQDDASLELLNGVGVVDAEVAGDTRFDRVTDILNSTVSMPEIERFASGSPGITFIAGSSWAPDEDVYLPWVNANKAVRVVIAPHEFDAHRIEALRRRVEGKCVTLSEIENGADTADDAKCIIVDCFGKLSSIYRYGNMAYIGGGFGAGIHNVNEAAVYGMPVVFGPNHGKFKEARDLIACGGAYAISSAQEFETVADRMLTDPEAREKSARAAGAYIKASIGATDRIWNYLSPVLSRAAGRQPAE